MENNVVLDSGGAVVEVCQDSQHILESIKAADIILACASRTHTTEIARQLVRLRGWHLIFDHMEIYPSSKVTHFTTLSKRTGVTFDQMIFFDDLSWNIKDTKQLGVHAHLVPNGINCGIVHRALKDYQQSRQ